MKKSRLFMLSLLAIGVIGLASCQGPKGETGDQGIQGEKGDTGDKGETGDQGPKGETGDKGEKGDRGDSGSNGISGADGKNGKDGDDGKDGSTFLTGKGDPNDNEDFKDKEFVVGDVYFDSEASMLYKYNGTSWDKIGSTKANDGINGANGSSNRTITVFPSAGGFVIPDVGSQVDNGNDDVSFTFIPDEGYYMWGYTTYNKGESEVHAFDLEDYADNKKGCNISLDMTSEGIAISGNFKKKDELAFYVDGIKPLEYKLYSSLSAAQKALETYNAGTGALVSSKINGDFLDVYSNYKEVYSSDPDDTDKYLAADVNIYVYGEGKTYNYTSSDDFTFGRKNNNNNYCYDEVTINEVEYTPYVRSTNFIGMDYNAEEDIKEQSGLLIDSTLTLGTFLDMNLNDFDYNLSFYNLVITRKIADASKDEGDNSRLFIDLGGVKAKFNLEVDYCYIKGNDGTNTLQSGFSLKPHSGTENDVSFTFRNNYFDGQVTTTNKFSYPIRVEYESSYTKSLKVNITGNEFKNYANGPKFLGNSNLTVDFESNYIDFGTNYVSNGCTGFDMRYGGTYNILNNKIYLYGQDTDGKRTNTLAVYKADSGTFDASVFDITVDKNYLVALGIIKDQIQSSDLHIKFGTNWNTKYQSSGTDYSGYVIGTTYSAGEFGSRGYDGDGALKNRACIFDEYPEPATPTPSAPDPVA